MRLSDDLRTRAWTMLLAVSATVGCAQYNDCEQDPGSRVGRAAIDLDIRERVVRTQETSVGDLVADATFAYATDACARSGPCPALALANAGGIREETACGLRDSIEAGAVFERDILDLLPFDNALVVVRITGQDLRLALERAVSRLGQIGENAAAGFFLQVSKLRFSVDCAQPAQALDPDLGGIENPGARVRDVVIETDAGEVPLDDEAEYEVAMNSFIGAGNDGFLSFLLRDADGSLILDADGERTPKMNLEQDTVRSADGDAQAASDAVLWLFEQADRDGVALGRPVDGRIRIENSCYGAAE